MMQKLSFPNSASFLELPLDLLNQAKYAVYIIDRNWNYLFVNDFLANNLGNRGTELIGKNMWTTFPELDKDETFKSLRRQTEKGLQCNIIRVSPLTSQKIHITGSHLKDCYVFTSSILPRKEDVIADLRSALGMRLKN